MGFDSRECAETGEPDLTGSFAPEFRSRLTKSIQFASLSEDVLGKIVDAKFERLREQVAEKGFDVSLDISARREFVRRTAERNAGARPVGPLLEEFGVLPLVEKLIRNEVGRYMKLDFSKGEFHYV